MWGSLITVPTLGVYTLAQNVYEFGDEKSVAMAFLVLASGQLFHVFNMRDPGASLWDNEITRNKWVWGAIALCIGLSDRAILRLPWRATFCHWRR